MNYFRNINFLFNKKDCLMLLILTLIFVFVCVTIINTSTTVEGLIGKVKKGRKKKERKKKGRNNFIHRIARQRRIARQEKKRRRRRKAEEKRKRLEKKEKEAAAEKKRIVDNTEYQDILNTAISGSRFGFLKCLEECPINYNTDKVILSSISGSIFGNSQILMDLNQGLTRGNANHDKHPQEFIFVPDGNTSDFVRYNDTVLLYRPKDHKQIGKKYKITNPSDPASKALVYHHNKIKISSSDNSSSWEVFVNQSIPRIHSNEREFLNMYNDSCDKICDTRIGII